MLFGDFRQTKIIIQLFELIKYFEFYLVAGAGFEPAAFRL